MHASFFGEIHPTPLRTFEVLMMRRRIRGFEQLSSGDEFRPYVFHLELLLVDV